MKNLTQEKMKQYAQICYEQGLKGENAWQYFRKLYKEKHNATIPNCGIRTVFISILETIA